MNAPDLTAEGAEEQRAAEGHSRVSRITIARLFNLGSYEHVRYEVTVEVPEGASAARTLIGLERLMGAINPKAPGSVKEVSTIRREQAHYEEMIGLSDDEFRRLHGRSGDHFEGTREEYQERVRLSIEEDKTKRTEWESRSKLARRLFDDLGGAEHFTDAKLSWEDDW